MVLHLLTGFSGRIGRGAFWLGVAIMFAIQLALSFLWVGMFHSTGGTETERAMGWLALAVLLWVSAALIVKRLHDRGKSALWYPLYGLAPALAYQLGVTFSSKISNELGLAQVCFWLVSWALWIWVFVELGCMRGTIGPNRFGPDPLTERAPRMSK